MGWNVTPFAEWPGDGDRFMPANTLGLHVPAVGPEAFSGAAAEPPPGNARGGRTTARRA